MAIPASGPLALTDIQTEFGGTNPIGLNEYYAGGGLVPAGTSGTYGAVPTSGQISVQNFYGTSNFVPIYVEEVFQTTLYTGTGANQSIVNGINFSGSGGMAWLKDRNLGDSPTIFDTVRGARKELRTSTAGAQTTAAAGTELYQFNSNGFNLGENWNIQLNEPGYLYTSWNFREQPKFFDVQTFTYPSSGSITVNHSLGSTPGCVIVKATDGADNWYVYHRMANNGTNPSNYIIQLNTTDAQINNFASWITVGSSSITFPSGALNPGSNFVMYLFAHDAGGFGLTGTDNVISCGGFTTDGGGGVTVNLGWEPQWVFMKAVSASGYDSLILDNMRGFPTSGDAKSLRAESSATEGNRFVYANATGFSSPNNLGSSITWVYIAIRRGPMKVPTDATKVFAPVVYSGNDATFQTITAGFPPDMQMLTLRNEAQTDSGTNATKNTISRLTGLNTVSTNTNSTPSLFTSTTGVESNIFGYMNFFQNTFAVTSLGGKNGGGRNYVTWNFRRAPSFFDVVCYLGSGTTTVRSHNLTVVPELIIFKYRNGPQGSGNWGAIHSMTSTQFGKMFLNLNIASLGPYAYTDDQGLAAQPTSTTFTPSPTSSTFNTSGNNYVAYLFATCPGVSKVGSYTGNGATQTINCGFTTGARFVMIKRTDTGASWFVCDTARGMTSTNPFLQMNNTAEELATSGAVTTVATGFSVDAGASGLVPSNVNGGSYIFLAIA